jgi:hypothetical protein
MHFAVNSYACAAIMRALVTIVKPLSGTCPGARTRLIQVQWLIDGVKAGGRAMKWLRSRTNEYISSASAAQACGDLVASNASTQPLYQPRTLLEIMDAHAASIVVVRSMPIRFAAKIPPHPNR